MKVSAIGPGQTNRIAGAAAEVLVWLKYHCKLSYRKPGIDWYIEGYKLPYPVKVIAEYYVDRNGFHGIRLLSDSKKAANDWRIRLRRIAGYKT